MTSLTCRFYDNSAVVCDLALQVVLLSESHSLLQGLLDKPRRQYCRIILKGFLDKYVGFRHVTWFRMRSSKAQAYFVTS
jgi:hypothetical protein